MTWQERAEKAEAENVRLRAEQLKDLDDVERFRCMARKYMDERDDLKVRAETAERHLAQLTGAHE